MTAVEQTRVMEPVPHRRAAWRAFRPRRALPATLTAAALAAAAILIAAEVIAALFGRSANVLPVAWLARLGRDTRWDEWPALTAACVAMALGLLLLLLALMPGRLRVIPLHSDDPDVVLGLARQGLRRHAASAAESVDGITHARVRAGRRRVRVRATSPLHDARGLHDAVRDAVAQRVGELEPVRPPRLRVTVRRRED